MGLVAGGEGAADFEGADGIDQATAVSDEVDDGEVGAGLLGEADGIEGFEGFESLEDCGGIVDEGGGAELASEVQDREAGDFGSEWGVGRHEGHGGSGALSGVKEFRISHGRGLE